MSNVDLELELNKLLYDIVHSGTGCCGKNRLIQRCIRVYTFIQEARETGEYPGSILDDIERQFVKLMKKINFDLDMLKKVIDDNEML